MSEEELLRKLEEVKKLKDTKYAEAKGMIKGIRLGKLSKADKDFLTLSEIMMDGFNALLEEHLASIQTEIQVNKRISNLETRIDELENNILQLRETLDRMVQDR